MIGHPLILAVTVADGIGLAAGLSAAGGAFRILTAWRPASADPEQIRLERRSEAAAITGRFVLAVFIAASVLLVTGISNVLPGIVPGAMCGTGVCQATDGLYTRAVVFRMIAALVLLIWLGLDRINREHPRAPLTLLGARVYLAGFPLLVLAAVDTLRAGFRLDVQNPVDCCTVVYDQVQTARIGSSLLQTIEPLLVPAFVGLSIGILLLGIGMGWFKRLRKPVFPALFCATAISWGIVATAALIRVFSAALYGVLFHHCPWCLLLSEHRWIGFPIFFCVAVVWIEGVFVWVAAGVSGRYPELAAICTERVGRAARRVTAAAAGFGILAGLPSVIWRLSHGVWITG